MGKMGPHFVLWLLLLGATVKSIVADVEVVQMPTYNDYTDYSVFCPSGEQLLTTTNQQRDCRCCIKWEPVSLWSCKMADTSSNILTLEEKLEDVDGDSSSCCSRIQNFDPKKWALYETHSSRQEDNDSDKMINQNERFNESKRVFDAFRKTLRQNREKFPNFKPRHCRLFFFKSLEKNENSKSSPFTGPKAQPLDSYHTDNLLLNDNNKKNNEPTRPGQYQRSSDEIQMPMKRSSEEWLEDIRNENENRKITKRNAEWPEWPEWKPIKGPISYQLHHGDKDATSGSNSAAVELRVIAKGWGGLKKAMRTKKLFDSVGDWVGRPKRLFDALTGKKLPQQNDELDKQLF